MIKQIFKNLHTYKSFFLSKIKQKPLSFYEFKTEFDPVLFSMLKDIKNRIQKISPSGDHVVAFEQVEKIIIHGGKRVRPYITYLSYCAGSSIFEDEKNLFQVLSAIEIFHVFALIHDDVIDDSVERHGVQTVHEALLKDMLSTHKVLRSGVEIQKIARNQAIMMGDLVFNASIHILIETLDVYMLKPFLKIFHQMAEEVVIGEMLDVEQTRYTSIEDSQIYTKTLLKSARYTFTRPMLLGFEFISMSEKYSSFAYAYGDALGIAFQIQDDFLDLFGDSTKTGKKTFTDIEEGQHTIFTQYLMSHMNIEEKNIFQGIIGKMLRTKTSLIEQEQKFITEMLEKYAVQNYGKQKIDLYLEEATSAIQSHKDLFINNPEVKIRFEELITLLKQRYS